MSAAAREEITSLIERLVEEYTAGDFVEDWDVPGLIARVQEIFIPTVALAEIDPDQVDREELTQQLQEEALAQYDQREQELGEELMRALERFLLLQIIDQRWREHLYDMDYLREGIHLRAAAQIEPLVAYKNEAFELFRDLMNSIWGDFARMIYHVQVTREGPDGGAGGRDPIPPRRASPNASSPTGGASRVSYSGGTAPQGAMAMAAAAASGIAGEEPPAPPIVQQRHADQEPGRNDPCWCGSGKKYKKCHGA
jgi:preprotein translocase subunit SecA